ncbi:MAG: ABC transporter ATP-binding protein [Maricaulaceae bacterium]
MPDASSPTPRSVQVPDQTVEPVLKLDRVTLNLPADSGPVEILKGVDMAAYPGESVAIVGPSGSGKSSLMSVAAGLEQATGGTITLLGEVVRALNEDGLARLRRGRVGFVFQSFHLVPTMNAVENVLAPLEIARLPDPGPRARAALEAVGLGHRLDHYPSQLSGGERQRVAVARALAPEPEIVFADEPTGNLDGAAGAIVAEMLFFVAAERNATLVLVTHDLEVAARADRQIRMRDGQIVE